MTVREAQEALRRERQARRDERDALERQLAAKNKKLDELDRKLARRDSGPEEERAKAIADSIREATEDAVAALHVLGMNIAPMREIRARESLRSYANGSLAYLMHLLAEIGQEFELDPPETDLHQIARPAWMFPGLDEATTPKRGNGGAH